MARKKWWLWKTTDRCSDMSCSRFNARPVVKANAIKIGEIRFSGVIHRLVVVTHAQERRIFDRTCEYNVTGLS